MVTQINSFRCWQAIGLATDDIQWHRRLSGTIAEGGDYSTLRGGIADREAKKVALASQLRECAVSTSDIGTLERHLPPTLSQWRKVLREPVDVSDAAAVLKKLIDGKLVCSPAVNAEGKGYYVITGEGTLRGALPHNLASPAGAAPFRLAALDVPGSVADRAA
jgi:hypothetical protein